MTASRMALLCVAAALAAPAWAQDWKGMGRMVGKVLDPDGKPVADAVVKLDQPARGGGPTVKTDKKGHWAVGGIVAGNWNIDIEAPGFETKSVKVNLPSESARLPTIELKLEKAAPKGPPPELVEAMQKGDQAFKEGRYAEARVEYEKMLAMRPEYATALHKQIAYTYAQEKNYAKVLEHLQKILDVEPDNTEIKTLMAMEAIEGGMLDKGLELLKTVDESKITSPEVFYNVGVQFRNADKSAEAIEYFGKAINVDPSYVDAYMQRGLSYVGLQKMPEAKADFQKVVELAPADSPQAQMAKKALESLK